MKAIASSDFLASQSVSAIAAKFAMQVTATESNCCVSDVVQNRSAAPTTLRATKKHVPAMNDRIAGKYTGAANG